MFCSRTITALQRYSLSHVCQYAPQRRSLRLALHRHQKFTYTLKKAEHSLRLLVQYPAMKIKSMNPTLLLLFVSSVLLAQTKSEAAALSSTSTKKTTTPSSHHVGVGNYYPIGSKAAPVTANEYCSFLNSCKQAIYNYYKITSYYDSSFMNCDVAAWEWGHQKIEKNDCITRHQINQVGVEGAGHRYDYYYRYSVIEGRGDFIIDALSFPLDNYTSCNATPSVLQKFNTWRKNHPSSVELAAYINAKIEGRDEAAQTLADCYPEDCQNVYGVADLIAEVALNNPKTCLSHMACDEKDHEVLTFSSESNEGNVPQAVVVKGMEYYRPSSIRWKTIPSSK